AVPARPGSRGSSMAKLTVISEVGTTDIAAELEGDRVMVRPDAVAAAIGWHLQPEGLCRGDVCVPVFDVIQVDDRGLVDLLAAARVLKRPTVLDAEAGALVVGVSSLHRNEALTGRQLPSFELPD